MGLSERLWMGGMYPQDVSEQGLGQMSSAGGDTSD